MTRSSVETAKSAKRRSLECACNQVFNILTAVNKSLVCGISRLAKYWGHQFTKRVKHLPMSLPYQHMGWR